MNITRLSIPLVNEAYDLDQSDFDGLLEKLTDSCNADMFLEVVEKLMPEEAKVILNDIPVMCYSSTVFNKIYEHFGISTPIVDVPAMMTFHEQAEYCGIMLAIESLGHNEGLIDCIRHELVHYNQWKSGELSWENRGWVWRGQRYELVDVTPPSNLPPAETIKWEILNIPWEADAYRQNNFKIVCADDDELLEWMKDYFV